MKHTDILNLWPDTHALAADIGQKQDTVRKWVERGRIPVEVWADILATRTAKRGKVTADKLLAALRS